MDRSKFVPRSHVVKRVEELVSLVKGKNVLHIGMGGFLDDETMTKRFIAGDLRQSAHGRIADSAKSVAGIDLNPETIEAMKQAVPGEYFVGDISDPAIAQIVGKQFDVVLFADVIEHLDDFRSALRTIRHLLKPEGTLVITTVNAFAFEPFFKMLLRYESVHSEHTSYFSYRTLCRLLAMNGFEVVDFSWAYEARSGFSSAAERFAYFLSRVVTRFMPQFSQDVIAVCRAA